MRKIDFEHIIGADGKERSIRDIKKFYSIYITPMIEQKLKAYRDSLTRPGLEAEFKSDVCRMIAILKYMLFATPPQLKDICDQWDARRADYHRIVRAEMTPDETKDKIAEFRNGILNAFNYAGFRKKELNALSVMLNVKSCMYCNQQYTISIGKDVFGPQNTSIGTSTAYLQFDHYFNKSDYPMLSMSLYNLIPSCGLCNQKKSKKRYGLKLHPYHVNLSDAFTFRIKDSNALLSPRTSIDTMEVEIDAHGDRDVKEFFGKMDLAKRYSRHLDIVAELECAKYLEPYYEKRLPEISEEFRNGMRKMSKDLSNAEAVLGRHLRGFYTAKESINLRPLTKFCQDIYDQLK